MIRRTRLSALLLLGLLAACAGQRPPLLEPLRDREAKTPVILLPGITGSQLRERTTGRVLWGDQSSLFFPRDGGYTLALPLAVPTPLADDPLEAFAPILGLRVLGLIRIDIYGSFVRMMEAHGYQSGDIDAPRPEDTFFVFSYDWRHENIRAAAVLAERLERIRLARGEPVLEVRLICQSNAARIARYYMKYGDATLEQAEAGSARPPVSVRVDKLIMVGSANGGALSTLRDLNRGRSYVPLIGRRFRPEVTFSFTSLYEALPNYRGDLFFDADGSTVDVDLYDEADWERFGWSIFAPDTAKRADRRPEIFMDMPGRRAFLSNALDRAQRLHRLLHRDVSSFGEARYYFVQNAYEPTEERGLLVHEKGEWNLWLGSDRRLRKDPYLSTLANTPGDGHTTAGSQMWLSPQEQRAIRGSSVFVPAPHRMLIRHPAAQRQILGYLLD